MALKMVREYRIQFVSGTTWDARSDEPPPSTASGWWKVERMDRRVEKNVVGWESMGTWLINIDNIEGIKDATPPDNAAAWRAGK